MSFKIITDTTANLTNATVSQNDITVIPFSYFINDREYTCTDIDSFDDTDYYTSIKNGTVVTTSQINPQGYIDCFEPFLKDGKDILFIGLSSGISGSFASAQVAAKTLKEEYPNRTVLLVDSLGASLGEGLIVIKAINCRKKGMDIFQTHEQLLKFRSRIYQVFIVDDLMHLRRTGRLSNISAAIGYVLGIKPLLKGNSEGKIVAFGKIRGRKQVIKALAEKFYALAQNPKLVGISYAGCKEDAEYLISLLKEKFSGIELMLVKHEPVTGSHIGPGALALYFEGGDTVREF
ncbi:MAG: DegV family protein [Oscillospiraceae bacterium]|nr:DegV family protein [Oscillospiraceae bacterium]MBQ3050085.1 DegV family protein [Oscillospiraceae bacterium]MBQ9938202.1 DegV family protein [Oscillospiraceae bacterium]